MAKNHNDDDEREGSKPSTTSERILKIMDSITGDLSNEELDMIIEALDRMKEKRKTPPDQAPDCDTKSDPDALS
jgi:hypothetical protein